MKSLTRRTFTRVLASAIAASFPSPSEPLLHAKRVFLTLISPTATINTLAAGVPSFSPRRLAWPRTSPFHGGNTGSNPVGDANKIKGLLES
jgi:hypothetical protein